MRRNGPRLDEAVYYRLQEIRDIARSGVTERTGKTHRVRHESGEESRSRRAGGMRSSYPELERLPDRDTPKKIAEAIERGKGKVFRRIQSSVRRELEPYVKEVRQRKEKPTVPAHSTLSAKCKTCHVAHGKGQHRFHGKGAFHRTHAFAFNPRGVVIYGRLLRIEAQKTQEHICDAECAAVNHRYFHDFKKGAKIFGLPNGDLLIKNSRS